MINALLPLLIASPSAAPSTVIERTHYKGVAYLKAAPLIRSGRVLKMGIGRKWFLSNVKGPPLDSTVTGNALSPNGRYYTTGILKNQYWHVGILDRASTKPPTLLYIKGGGLIQWSPDSTKFLVDQVSERPRKLVLVSAQGKILATYDRAYERVLWAADSKAAIVHRVDGSFEYFPKIATAPPETEIEAGTRVLGFKADGREESAVWNVAANHVFVRGKWAARSAHWLAESRDYSSPVTITGKGGFKRVLPASCVIQIAFLDDSHLMIMSTGRAFDDQRDIPGLLDYLTIVSLPSLKREYYGLYEMDGESFFR